MPRIMELQSSKTYATRENVIRAVEKHFGEHGQNLRYVIMKDEDGRYWPLFIGTDALHAQVFRVFPVAA